MFIIIDWQDEDNITVLQDDNGITQRFTSIEVAQLVLIKEYLNTNNIYLTIKEFDR